MQTPTWVLKTTRSPAPFRGKECHGDPKHSTPKPFRPLDSYKWSSMSLILNPGHYSDMQDCTQTVSQLFHIASVSLPEAKSKPKPLGLEIHLLGGSGAAQGHRTTHPAPDLIPLPAIANRRSGCQQGNTHRCMPHSLQCHLLARDSFRSCARKGCRI